MADIDRQADALSAYVAEYDKIECRCPCHNEDRNCPTGSPCCAIWGQRRRGDHALVAGIRELREQVARLTQERDDALHGRVDSDNWADQFRGEREAAEAQVLLLARTLAEMLDEFYIKPPLHPALPVESCVRSSYVEVERVEAWREVLASLPKPPAPNPTCCNHRAADGLLCDMQVLHGGLMHSAVATKRVWWDAFGERRDFRDSVASLPKPRNGGNVMEDHAMPCEGCGTLVRIVSSDETATANAWAGDLLRVYCSDCWPLPKPEDSSG